MEPRHHRPDRDVEDLGDLLVRETLDIGEQHGHPELLGQRLERLLDLVVGEAVEQLVLGAAAERRRLEPAQPPVEVQVLDVLEVMLVGTALLGPVRVDEGVGEDPVEPGLEVRALLEAPEAPVGPEVRLLDRSSASAALRVMRSAAEYSESMKGIAGLRTSPGPPRRATLLASSPARRAHVAAVRPGHSGSSTGDDVDLASRRRPARS